MKNQNKLIAVICATILIASVLTGCVKTQKIGNADAGSLAKGDSAPTSTVNLSDGNTFSLPDNNEQVVVINFWATWCIPCCEELPLFDKLNDEYGDKVKIIAINYGEDKNTVDTFIAERGYKYLFGYDEDISIASLFPMNGIPYTVIIDSNGRVAETFNGVKDVETQYNKYEKAIEEAMNN